jgi:transcriptional regulator with XRE-family HTH domain
VDEGKEMARLQLQRDPTTQRATARHAPQQPDPITLGVQTYVRSLRERQSISRKALADVIDLPIGLVADWESGRTGMIPPQALVRAIVHLGATLDDLEQIATATDKHTALGQRLAEERSASTRRGDQPSQNMHHAVHSAPPFQRVVVRKVVAIEGLLHDVVGVLKRAFPTEAAEIERSTALWFQTITSDEE